MLSRKFSVLAAQVFLMIAGRAGIGVAAAVQGESGSAAIELLQEPEGPPQEAAPAEVPSAESEVVHDAAAAPEIPAATPAEPAPVASAGAGAEAGWPGTAFPFIKAIGATGLLLSLVFLGIQIFRRYAPQYFAPKPAERMLRLVESVGLGEKRSVAVIEFSGQKYLIGNTPSQITLLASLSGAPAATGTTMSAPAVERPVNTPTVARGGFLSLLTSQKNQRPAAAGSPAILPPDIRGKMRELREALEG